MSECEFCGAVMEHSHLCGKIQDLQLEVATMSWHLSHRADKRALPLADRHYNRQKIGSPQYVPPGRCLCLLTEDAGALWVTSWPFAQYVKHKWPGAWVNSLFRRERGPLASDLIREAVAATRWNWPEAPALGMITFVDARKVHHKRDPGRCYIKAGFHHVGEAKDGKLCFQLLPDEMPAARPPNGAGCGDGNPRP